MNMEITQVIWHAQFPFHVGSAGLDWSSIAREILENILGVTNSNKSSISSNRKTLLNIDHHNALAVCGRIKSNTIPQ